MSDKMKEALKLAIEGKREESKAVVAAALDEKKTSLLSDAKQFIKQNLFRSGT